MFEWDQEKARKNLQKHGVAFDVAQTIFDYPRLTKWDFRHEEDREVSVGMSGDGRILTVVYIAKDDKIRIISVRKATKQERKIYNAYHKKP